jgi:CHAT domain-containing protein
MLILEPLATELRWAERLVVVLDDVLHLVPLDGLPLNADTFVGDRWQIETRTTLAELLQWRDAPRASGTLVAFGDIDYGARRIPSLSGEPVRAVEEGPLSRAPGEAGILRGTAWSEGFPSLPGTGAEVRGIARCFDAQVEVLPPPVLCERTHATRESLFALAHQARWLHIATHGWFAPESIPSWSDAGPLDARSGLGVRPTGVQQVTRMSPMLLCGIALAGSNSPEDATGRLPGLLTAEELSTLDLIDCELVVLSACDTNVGEPRAGQGVASLQRALHMAGARSVITSLWKVPDEATKDLMIDFYSRLWLEKKPKLQALWEAKRMLRDARNEHGKPRYSTRDWAAWVLTGGPD